MLTIPVYISPFVYAQRHQIRSNEGWRTRCSTLSSTASSLGGAVSSLELSFPNHQITSNGPHYLFCDSRSVRVVARLFGCFCCCCCYFRCFCFCCCCCYCYFCYCYCCCCCYCEVLLPIHVDLGS